VAATNPATIEDLQARSFRTLTAQELTAGAAYIEDAWFLLTGYRPQILADLDTGTVEAPKTPNPAFVHNVKRLIIAMVKRVVDNPEGKLEETGDDYSYRRDSVASDGRLNIYPDEISWLYPAQGTEAAFTIRPGQVARTPVTPFFGPIVRSVLSEEDFWDSETGGYYP
jgi:hypothetical protein